MTNIRDINSYFIGVLENINLILNANFYGNKGNLKDVKLKIQKRYDNYKINNSLKNIDPEELKYLSIEITDFFANYVEIESLENNFTERLSYDFGHLEICWKNEMLGVKNGR